jgi:D-alanyl-D-alanine dipeptidase
LKPLVEVDDLPPSSLQSAVDGRPPAHDLERWVGQYGAPRAVLDLYEQEGQLFAEGLGFAKTALRQASSARFIGRRSDAAGRSEEVDLIASADRQGARLTLGDNRLERRDFGGEGLARFQAALQRRKRTLPASANHVAPPPNPQARPTDLVRIADIDPTIGFDIKYATTDNFLGRPIYDRAAAYLQRPAAQALSGVQSILAGLGFALLVHDAYRPWSVTKLFWDVTPAPFRMFVADPEQGSQHNRGCAVDLTLVDLGSGQPVEMPGWYDEPTRRSYCDYFGGTSRQRWRRDLLRGAMEAHAFTVHPLEWWHFDFEDAGQYAVEDIAFADLDRR